MHGRLSFHWHGFLLCHTRFSMLLVTTDVHPVSHGYHWSHVVSNGHRLSNVVINIPVTMTEQGKFVMTHSVSMVMQVKSQRKSGRIVGDITSRLPWSLWLPRWCRVSHKTMVGHHIITSGQDDINNSILSLACYMMLNTGQMSPKGGWWHRVGENICTVPVCFVEKYQVEFLSLHYIQPPYINRHIYIFKIWICHYIYVQLPLRSSNSYPITAASR